MDLSLRTDPKQGTDQKPSPLNVVKPGQKAAENLKLEAPARHDPIQGAMGTLAGGQSQGIPFQVYLQGFMDLIEMILAASKIQAAGPEKQQVRAGNIDVKQTQGNDMQAAAPEREKELPKTIVILQKEETKEPKKVEDKDDGNDDVQALAAAVNEAPKQQEAPVVEEKHVQQFTQQKEEEFVAPVKQEAADAIEEVTDTSDESRAPEVKRDLPVLKLDGIKEEEADNISLNVSDIVNQIKEATGKKTNENEQVEEKQPNFRNALESQLKSTEEVDLSVETAAQNETGADDAGTQNFQTLQQANQIAISTTAKAATTSTTAAQSANSEQVSPINAESRGATIQQEVAPRTEQVPEQKEPDAPEMLERIVKITKMMKANGKTSVKVSISTEGLGEVRVRLVMRGKELNVTFHTDNSKVDRLMNANADTLHARLKSEGITTVNLKFEQNEEKEHSHGNHERKQKYHEEIFSAFDDGGEEDEK